MAEFSKIEKIPVKGQIEGSAKYNGVSWQIRITYFDDEGEPKYGVRKGFTSSDEANKAKEKYDADYKKEARRRGLATNYSEDMSVKEYFEYYLQEILASKCQSSTEMVYRYTLYKHILPNWKADPLLSQVEDTELNSLLDKINDSSAIAANKAREFIYLALRHAYYNEKRIKKLPKLRRFPRPEPSVNVLNTAEIQELLLHASKTDWYLEILLALFLGMRKGEIRGLKFSDFDEATHTVRIERQLSEKKEFEEGGYKTISREKVLKEPKSSTSSRTLHVPDYVWQEVINRKLLVEEEKFRSCSNYIDNGYVSCQKNGESRGVTSMNLALNKICLCNGIKHMTVHGLRHCYASILLELNYELSVISSLLGHSSINTTYEMYAGIIDDDKEIVTYLNELFAMDDEED